MAAAAAVAAASLDEAKSKNVLRQVEFYFSDSNLPRDDFLLKTVEESDDGLVSLALICSFSRMKSHLGLEVDVKPETVPEETVLAVAEVLRRSSVLRVSEDGKKVGRATELLKPDEVIEQVDSRTIAASPLPYNVKLEDVQSFFAQYAKVNSVRLPRHISDKRHFCGTALVEFSEEEEAKSVMKNKLVFAGADLEIKPKKEFDAEREAKREALGKTHPNKSSPNEGYPKGLIVAFKLRRIIADGNKEQNDADKVDDVEGAKKEETSNSTGKSGMGSEERIPDNSDIREEQAADNQQVKEINTGETTQSGENATVDASAESERKDDDGPMGTEDRSLSGNEDNPVLREDLKEEFKKFGTVKYVDYSMGGDSGYIRFEDSQAAEKARAFAVLADEGGLIVKGHLVTLEPVTGEAEKEYWDGIRGAQGKYNFNRSYKGRDAKNKRGGGRQFGGKRGRHFDSQKKGSNKAHKVDASA